MTAAQDVHEASAEDGSASRQASRHRAAGSPSVPARLAWDRRLAALAVVPCAGAALLGVLAILVLTRASHAPLLHGHTLAALVLLGVALLAVIAAGLVWAARVAQEARAAAGGRAGVAYLPYVEPDTPDAASGRAAAAYPPGAEPDAPDSATASARKESVEAEVFVQLSHRLQSLVHQQIEVLDGLENEVEDPDLLKGLFAADHLATRMRRHAENLGVLGGAVPRRQWSQPVSLMEVLRSAVSETPDYARVQVITRAAVRLNGYVLADVVHLLAELVENATKFAPPDTKVTVRTQSVVAGLAIEVDDRGVGMAQDVYDNLNALLRDPTGVSVQQLLKEGRIGMYVVAQLARRHGIAVVLQPNVTFGTQALVVLPAALLAVDPVARSVPAMSQGRAAETAPPRRTGEVAAADGSADAGVGSATVQSEPFPSGSLPTRRRTPTGPGSAIPTGARGATATTEVIASAAAVPPAGDARPPLPQRQPQQHLAQPLAVQASASPGESVSDGELTPGLMGALRLGVARGNEQPIPENGLNEFAPTQEGR